MRYFVLIALLCSCRRQVPPAPPVEAAAESSGEEEQAVPPELWSWSWSSVSVATGALAQVRQTASAKGRCQVSASVGSKRLWSVEACIAKREDLRFASSDALALVVLNPLPDVDDATLGAVYRKGARVFVLTPASLHLPASATRIEGNKLHWLGAREQREMPEGVEVQLLDGSVRMIRFDGGPIAVPASGLQDKALPTAECSPCAYTDVDGVYHLVDDADEIPAQYRGRAGRIRGSIQHAVAVPVTYRPPSSLESSKPVRRAARATTPAPTGDLDVKCLDSSGAKVPCAQIGIQIFSTPFATPERVPSRPARP
jgi:hypothetical protein